MLSPSGLSQTFWVKVVATVAYLINRSHFLAIDFKTPQKLWSETPFNYHHLRTFICVAYAHINNSKLESRAIKGIFIGYPNVLRVINYGLMNLETTSV